jgi:hypothetical protein
MARQVKIASQLPEEVHQLYFELDHGQKQLACAAGLLMYFAQDEQVQWAYREWARAIAEGRATIGKPPEALKRFVSGGIARRKRPRKSK